MPVKIVINVRKPMIIHNLEDEKRRAGSSPATGTISYDGSVIISANHAIAVAPDRGQGGSKENRPIAVSICARMIVTCAIPPPSRDGNT